MMSVNIQIVMKFHLQTFSIVSGVVCGKGIGFYGRKSTGIFSFGFTILYTMDSIMDTNFFNGTQEWFVTEKFYSVWKKQ